MIISKSELTDQLVYTKQDFKTLEIKTSSKGTIPKYTNGHLWVKTDVWGYNSLAEVIASRAAQQLGINTVIYNPCFFEYNEFEVSTACISESFTHNYDAEITLGRLLQQIGKFKDSSEVYQVMFEQPSTVQRIQWVCDLVKDYIDTEVLLHYLAEMIWFDSLILNTDRHIYNIVFLVDNSGYYKPAPLFDYGASLLSDLQEFPLAMPLQRAIWEAESSAKPFASKFSKQLKALNKYLPKIKTDSLAVDVGDLYKYYPSEWIDRAIKVLQRLNSDKTSVFDSK